MATRQAPLRAVRGSKRAPQTIFEATESGTPLDELLALRRRLAKALDADTTAARDLAVLSRRLMEISQEIEAINAVDKGDTVGKAATTPDEQWDASAI